MAWNDAHLSSSFLLIPVSNPLVNGPVIVGIPILADLRFAEGVAFGMILSAYGGSLLGTARRYGRWKLHRWGYPQAQEIKTNKISGIPIDDKNQRDFSAPRTAQMGELRENSPL